MPSLVHSPLVSGTDISSQPSISAAKAVAGSNPKHNARAMHKLNIRFPMDTSSFFSVPGGGSAPENLVPLEKIPTERGLGLFPLEKIPTERGLGLFVCHVFPRQWARFLCLVYWIFPTLSSVS